MSRSNGIYLKTQRLSYTSVLREAILCVYTFQLQLVSFLGNDNIYLNSAFITLLYQYYRMLLLFL